MRLTKVGYMAWRSFRWAAWEARQHVDGAEDGIVCNSRHGSWFPLNHKFYITAGRVRIAEFFFIIENQIAIVIR